MSYEIEYVLQEEVAKLTGQPWFEPRVISNVEWLPRIGEVVEVDDCEYTVQHVVHFTDGSPPIVQVRS